MGRYRFWCPRRWGDLDAQNHVNNASYLDYLQEARVDFLLTGPPELQALLVSGVLVVSHQVEYLAPLPFGPEPVAVELWVDAVGASRFAIGYEVWAADVLVARARTAAAPYDLATNRLRRLSAPERDHLRERLHSVPGLPPLPTRAVRDTAHRFPLRVRWSDLDSYGHVNNVKFFDYLQEARVALGSMVPGGGSEEVWLLRRQDIDYLKPLDFRLEPYQVRTDVTEVGNRSVTLAAVIGDPSSEVEYARARSVIVAARPLTGSQRVAFGEP